MKKKKDLSTIILVAVFALGLAILLYPSVSNWWNSRVQTRAIVDYAAAMANLEKEDYTAELEKADAYNEALRELASPLADYEELEEEYLAALDVTGTGIIGYITIPRLDVELPIYHGTSDAVLASSAGHLEGTSLPVGGEGTHCVISAHRGLPSAKLFTDLDQLVEGDTFTITVLDETLTYEVDQIRTVLPDEVSDLAIEEGKDYCTLLTCTPYGINTHRLLVRGHRVENATSSVRVPADAMQIEPVTVAPIIAVPLLVLLFIGLMVRTRKRRPEETRAPNSRRKHGKKAKRAKK